MTETNDNVKRRRLIPQYLDLKHQRTDLQLQWLKTSIRVFEKTYFSETPRMFRTLSTANTDKDKENPCEFEFSKFIRDQIVACLTWASETFKEPAETKRDFCGQLRFCHAHVKLVVLYVFEAVFQAGPLGLTDSIFQLTDSRLLPLRVKFPVLNDACDLVTRCDQLLVDAFGEMDEEEELRIAKKKDTDEDDDEDDDDDEEEDESLLEQ
jgi:hypothetical protein